MRQSPGEQVWQRNYYEHVIRNEEELIHIRQYILENPIRWEMDRENPGYRKCQDDDRDCRGTARRAPTEEQGI
jgi:hypothetical protein